MYAIENIASDMLTVSSLVTHFAMSESTLLRQLKRLTGLSPKQYLQEVRLNTARLFLETGEHRSISDVARRVGYTRLHSFSRSFKERFGVSPSEMINT